MKAKDLKNIIIQIPDENNVIFTYSMFVFEDVSPIIIRGEEINKYFTEEGIETHNIPHSKNDCMIEFND